MKKCTLVIVSLVLVTLISILFVGCNDQSSDASSSNATKETYRNCTLEEYLNDNQTVKDELIKNEESASNELLAVNIKIDGNKYINEYTYLKDLNEDEKEFYLTSIEQGAEDCKEGGVLKAIDLQKEFKIDGITVSYVYYDKDGNILYQTDEFKAEDYTENGSNTE